MKKFGTPSGEGPGTAKEKVGLEGVGTPGPLGPVVAGGFGEDRGVLEPLGPLGPLEPLLLGPVGPEEPVVPREPLPPWWPLPPPPPLDPLEWEGEDELVVELPEEDEPDPEPDPDPEPEPDPEPDPDEPVETLGVVDVLGAHEADTLLTGPTLEGTIAEGGVPGGALTVKVSVPPVNSVTVTVH